MTFELPPFAKESLPDGGAAVAAFKELYRKEGYNLKVSFAPVIRAKKQAAERADVDGYFPAVSENIQKNFILSRTVHVSTWGVAERADRPVIWRDVSDLKKYRIGNVVGYDLAAVLWPLQKEKALDIEEAASDELNLLKLAKGRLDLVFIDSAVFNRLMQTNEQLKGIKKKLQFNPKPLQVYQYGVAFKNSPNGKEALRIFNASFTEAGYNSAVESYLHKNKAFLP
ncbi:ABC transporter substrate-binding protein [Bdellovibrio sp. ZAP7]|uniref:substrate-binding periplasmic protein n=1 Tax=Bdellovibrio sp. ZAP7 TaxID=2231053 RepID=UPI00143CFBD8|nr:ABC transporter substrate-binding protein [Bdellovibrio sp. ZAP7]